MAPSQNLTISLTGRAICLNLTFSPCGEFLRVAKVEAAFWKGQEQLENSNNDKAKLRLYLHILIFRMSPIAVSNIHLRLIGNTTMRIGCGVPQLVHQLPFAFTWTDKYLYLTVSSSQLRVYRADLEMASKPHADEAFSPGLFHPSASSPYRTTKRKDSWAKSSAANPPPIFTIPSEIIFLPRSARDRTVQFFPGSLNGGGSSCVVVGPRFGSRPQPGVVIYLTDRDLGDWVDIGESERGEARQERAHQRVMRNFEEFDEEEDCDIIPVLER